MRWIILIFMMTGIAFGDESGYRIEKTEIEGKDIARAFGWEIYKYHIHIPEGMYKVEVFLDYYVKDKKKKSFKLSGVTGAVKSGELLIMMPDKTNPKYCVKINGNGTCGELTREVDLSETAFQSTVMSSDSGWKSGKDKILGLVNYSEHYIQDPSDLEKCINENIKLEGFKKMTALRLKITKQKESESRK